ncbi:MAG TPA: Gfo/Idh/MocA family oxidoreductase [Candidatus Hydrogenedentes bacterium]|nr:Gfo/Idh/MocA family oxidoreductase [Candidatus Hydrogenedentota bacterium]HPG66339.1 Gfo/Idh/MocA family oxidoreductase [Candidatus Hydrogenedentota bacterium]
MDTGTKRGITRRDFAKASAIASFAILSSRSGLAETNSDTLKVGLLGCGNRGSGAAINMLEGKNNVKLVAMADLFQDRLDSARNAIKDHKDPEVTSRYAVEDDMCFVGWDAYKQILATDIDIVIEGTLPYSRPKHIEAAVEAKKHIFTEKPVASTPEGIRQVLAAAEKHKAMGLSFVAGTQRRHDSAYQETIQKIRDGEIGEIKALRAYWCGGLPFAYDRKPEWSDLEYRVRNWYAYCWVAGDNIVEQHVHNIDVCNWVMGGPPVRVFASGGRTWKPNTEKYGDIYDHFSCDFEYENGVRMFSFSRHWNRCAGGVFEEVIGTTGKSNCQDKGERGQNPYVQEHIDLVNSITKAGPYWHQGQEVAESTMTAIMGRMSAYTGENMTFNRALKTDLNIVPTEFDFSKEYPVAPVPSPGAGEG